MSPDDEDGFAPDDDLPLSPAETPTVDVANVRALRRSKRDAFERQRQAQEFWQKVFADPVGRREMWAILEASHAFSERFAAGPAGFPDPLATWFHAGEQALGHRLYLTWMQLDRAGVLLMQDEHDPRFAKPAKRGATDA